jgi:hypothetical protein
VRARVFTPASLLRTSFVEIVYVAFINTFHSKRKILEMNRDRGGIESLSAAWIQRARFAQDNVRMATLESAHPLSRWCVLQTHDELDTSTDGASGKRGALLTQKLEPVDEGRFAAHVNDTQIVVRSCSRSGRSCYPLLQRRLAEICVAWLPKDVNVVLAPTSLLCSHEGHRFQHPLVVVKLFVLHVLQAWLHPTLAGCFVIGHRHGRGRKSNCILCESLLRIPSERSTEARQEKVWRIR